MKKKCNICGTVEETYIDSPNHILGLCAEHIKWFHEMKEQGREKELPLWLRC